MLSIMVIHSSDQWKRNASKCYYCGWPMADLPKSQRTVDHRIPLGRGGADTAANRVACCRRCNEEKGSLTQAEFESAKERFMLYEMRIVAQALGNPRLAVEMAHRFADWAMDSRIKRRLSALPKGQEHEG